MRARSRTTTRTNVRIRQAVTAAAVLPVLALAAACSGDDGGSGDGKGKDGATTAPATSAAGSSTGAAKAPLTAAQLRSALVKDTEVPGYKIEASKNEAMSPDDVMTTDKPECQPLADPPSTRPKYARKAFVGASVGKIDPANLPAGVELTQMLLASHAPGEAGKMVADIRQALDKCTAFTATDGTGKKIPFAIRKGPAVTVGDEAVSYVMADTGDKEGGTALVTVVRTGDASVTYLSVKGTGQAGDPPLVVARKQDTNLKAAEAAG
ncbi:sensor domain-containing protein [Streptomyces sp. SID13666]|uniref:sensor domain-containing protein n=1 Tax=Streptomyces TaxID=1883 RepID=UPI0013C255C0|nr:MULTISPECIES: sensor domain-containing protein [Streptomyces]MCZ4095776.1 sensor domain-containing protein [Streptomyces sp. H39-C1]NEA54354.1 sensor domain-containing protein [Streptomyces sp. SID13666]NEA72271.1 sensor domain-containing protein [Streptomyces sp. SID13588]